MLQHYRKTLAYVLSLWFMTVVISGAIFTHKEVTSTGEIVIHNHPYDFTQTGQKKHHHSDSEIHFLDVVFLSTFTPTPFFYFDFSPIEFCIQENKVILSSSTHHVEHDSFFNRGPPATAINS